MGTWNILLTFRRSSTFSTRCKDGVGKEEKQVVDLVIVFKFSWVKLNLHESTDLQNAKWRASWRIQQPQQSEERGGEEIEGEGLLKNSCNTSKREWKEGKLFSLSNRVWLAERSDSRVVWCFLCAGMINAQYDSERRGCAIFTLIVTARSLNLFAHPVHCVCECVHSYTSWTTGEEPWSILRSNWW